jgi:hypothetical protein
MDPLALAAVVGLVFAGQRLSDDKTPVTTDDIVMLQPGEKKSAFDLINKNFAQQDRPLDPRTTLPDAGRVYNDFRLRPKEAVASFQDVSKDSRRFPYGQPVYDLYSRQGVSGKMNNLAPLERQYVGRGLGVGPNTAAAGGFHQFFRVLPANINEERLHTMKGAFSDPVNTLGGPSNAVVKAGGPVAPKITHEAKDTKAWHRDPAQTSGQGQGGVLRAAEGRPDQIKTRRLTIRDETGERTGDTLQLGTGSYFVKQPYATGEGSYTDIRLTRSTENRINPDRSGNGQRMNVRADPIGAAGAITNVRAESVPFPVQGADPGKRYNPYKDAEYYKFNPFRMNPNPNATPQALDIAIQQLKKNDLAQPPLAVL